MRIFLLTDAMAAAVLTNMIVARTSSVGISVIEGREALDKAFADQSRDTLADVRLFGFVTGVMVPKSYLDLLTLEPVNLHPATPDYPGKHPLPFALRDRVTEFGATAHVMTPKVDSGPILAVARFDMIEGATEDWLRYRTYRAAFNLAEHLIPHLLAAAPLSVMPNAVWGDRDCSQKAHDALLASRD